MRKLNVRRRKAFAGCLGKVKLYIEDENGETVINGTKCRLLGKLKNKESATYEIDNESHKLFAIYDKASKGFCNDFYTISAGEDDVDVTGAAHLNPFQGNPFYFDGVTNPEVLANREKNSKKSKMIMIPVLICAVILGAVGGYYLSSLIF